MNTLISQIVLPVLTALLLASFKWPFYWLLSGTPILTQCLILGEKQETRILQFAPLWTLITLLNLSYSLAATSWLFYWLFTIVCYQTIFISCLFQFELVARIVRKQLRNLLRGLHFTNDKVSFFNIPALEIDTEVEGLLVVRGVTISLAKLSITAHGVEVGIKLSEDMEFAIQVEHVQILFFRRINIGDVYANLKGGEYEMTFGNLAKRNTGEGLMVSDTPLLEAAALKGNTMRPDMVRTTSKLTNGAEPKQVSAKAGFDSMTQLSPDDGDMTKAYQRALEYIEKTSLIQDCMRKVEEATSQNGTSEISSDIKSLRAAVCSQLHEQPSVPHPPTRSVKVTTLQNLSSPRTRKFMHRLPFLLRLLLNPLGYFHPINIESVTAAGSGKWIQHMLHEKVFKYYGEENAGIRKLEKRVSDWLSEANFVLELVNFRAQAQVPITPTFDVINQIKIGDVLAYRTLPAQVELTQVVRLAGADATIEVPSFLLPHHEHLLPPLPDRESERDHEKEVENADGKPQEVHAQVALEQLRKDETNVKIAVRATLPAVFDQQLLDFIAALVKAVKIIEMEKDPEPEAEEEEPELAELSPVSSTTSTMSPTKMRFRGAAIAFRDNMRDNMKDMGGNMKDMRDKMRRVGVDAVVNDKWIAKIVGRVTKSMETLRGDIGYSGDIPVALQPYRDAAEKELKLLP